MILVFKTFILQELRGIVSLAFHHFKELIFEKGTWQLRLNHEELHFETTTGIIW